MPGKKLFAGILILVAVVLILSYWLLTSIWLAWFLLPEGEMRLAVNSELPIVQENRELVSQVIPAEFLDAKLVSISQSNEVQTIVILPKLKQQLTMANELKLKGWRVQRLGLMLRAQSSNSVGKSSLLNGVKNAAQIIVGTSLPVTPVVILETGALTLVGSNSGSKLIINALEGSNNVLAITGNKLATAISQSRSVSLIVPGNSLQALPAALSAALNEELHNRLGIVNTQPAILSYLSQFETVYLNLSGDTNVQLGVVGAAQSFIETSENWLQEDSRYDTLEPKWFKLPDGTLGQELSPGEADSVFGAVGEDCRTSEGRAVQINLCQKDASAFLSNQFPGDLPELQNQDWSISISGDSNILQENISCTSVQQPWEKLVCSLEQITATGSGSAITIEVRLRQ